MFHYVPSALFLALCLTAICDLGNDLYSCGIRLVRACAHWCNVPGMPSEARLGRSVFLNSHTGLLAGDLSFFPPLGTTYCLSLPKESPQKAHLFYFFSLPLSCMHIKTAFFFFFFYSRPNRFGYLAFALYAVGHQTFKERHSRCSKHSSLTQ